MASVYCCGKVAYVIACIAASGRKVIAVVVQSGSRTLAKTEMQLRRTLCIEKPWPRTSLAT